MNIESLRVVDNETTETAEGTVLKPVSYTMDVRVSDEGCFAIPISDTTYKSLHSLFAAYSVAEDTNQAA